MSQANSNLFPFNSSFMATLQNISDTCGYTDYLDKYVTYPPAGPLPLPYPKGVNARECDIADPIYDAVSTVNPVFDIYRVTDQWPSPWSVLGFPQSTQEFIYFNRCVSSTLSLLSFRFGTILSITNAKGWIGRMCKTRSMRHTSIGRSARTSRCT